MLGVEPLPSTGRQSCADTTWRLMLYHVFISVDELRLALPIDPEDYFEPASRFNVAIDGFRNTHSECRERCFPRIEAYNASYLITADSWVLRREEEACSVVHYQLSTVVRSEEGQLYPLVGFSKSTLSRPPTAQRLLRRRTRHKRALRRLPDTKDREPARHSLGAVKNAAKLRVGRQAYPRLASSDQRSQSSIATIREKGLARSCSSGQRLAPPKPQPRPSPRQPPATKGMWVCSDCRQTNLPQSPICPTCGHHKCAYCHVY